MKDDLLVKRLLRHFGCPFYACRHCHHSDLHVPTDWSKAQRKEASNAV